MSKLVDERVVELKFDNSNFERNTRQSMATVREMKSSLNFSGMASSINTAINSVNFSPITDSLETTKKSFDALEVVAINVLSRITQDAITAGKQLIESLSIDNASAGWEKYESLAKSIGTLVKILTSSMSEEEAMEEATKYMNKLMYYSDATSYSIEQMASAFSTLVNKGMNLQDAYEAVIGISNWAAASGKDINETAAIYQALSKASGHVTGELMRSIRLAKMDTVEWKQAILEAAVAAGTLNKGVENFDGTIEYTTKNGKIVSIENFSDALEDGWFLVDEVLMKTLKDYGMAVDKVSEYQESNNLETPFDALEKYTEELKLAREEALALGDAEKVSAIDAELFSLKTFDAASEARTLTDAIRATKDAVSTGWTKAFTSLTGNYVEATELFSDFADELTAIFTASTTAINNALSLWRGYTPEVIEEQKKLQEQEKYLLDNRKELTKEQIKEYEEEINAHKEYIKSMIAQNDHRVDLFGNKGDEDQGALWNLLDAIKLVVSAIKDAWKDVFPVKKSLGEITESIKEFTKNLIPSEEGLETIKGIFKGLFAILKLGKKIIEGVFAAIKPIKDIILESSGSILGFLGKIGNKFADWVDNLTIFKKIGTAVGNAIKDIINVFKELKIIDKVKESFAKLGEELKERFDGKGELGKALDSLKENFTAIWKTLLSGLKEFLKFMVNNVLPIMINAIKYVVIFASYVVKGVKIALEKIIEVVSKFIETVKANENVQNGWKSFIDFMKSIPSKLSKLEPFFKKLGSALSSFFKALWNGIVKVGEALSKVVNFKSLGDLFAKIGEKIKYGFDKIVQGIQSFKAARMDNAMKGVKKEMTPLQTLFQGLIDLFVGLKNIFLALIVVVGSVLSTIGNMLTTLGENLKGLFNEPLSSGAKGLNIWAIINGGIVALIAKGLYDFIWLFRSITNVIKDTIDSVGSVFRAKAIKEWAESIKKVAEAILILVAALLLLTMIDEQELTRAMGVLFTLMGTLSAAVIAIGKFMNTAYSMKADALFTKEGFLGLFQREGNSWGGVARMILSFGLAMVALAAALKIISKIPEKDIWRAFWVLTALMGVLTISMGLMNLIANINNKIKKSMKGIKGMLSFSLGILVLTFALQKIAKMNINNAWMAFGIISAMVALFSGLSVATNKFKPQGISNMLTMSLAIIMLMIPLTIIGKMKAENVWMAYGVIAALTAMFGGLSIVTNKFKPQGMSNMIVMASALILLAVVLRVIGSMKVDELRKAGIVAGVVVGAIILLCLAFNKLSSNKNIIKISNGSKSAGVFKSLAMIALTIMAISITLLSIVILTKIMGTVNWNNVWSLFGMLALMFVAAGAMIAASYGLTKLTNDMPKLQKSLLLFSMVLGVLIMSVTSIAIAATLFNGVYSDSLKKVIGSLITIVIAAGALMSVLAIISSKTGDMNKLKSTMVMFGTLLTLLISAVVSIAVAATLFNGVSSESLSKVLMSLASVFITSITLMSALAIIASKTSKMGKLVGTIALFAVVLATIMVATDALMYIATAYEGVSWDAVGRMLLSIGSILGAALLILALSSKIKVNGNGIKNLLILSISLSVIAGVMVGFAALISLMSKLNLTKVLQIMGIMALAVVVIGALAMIAGTLKTKLDAGAVTLIKLGAAFILFAIGASAFAIATSMLTSDIGGLIAFGAVLLALGIAGKLLSSAAPGLLMVGVAFLAIGVACLAVSASFYLMVSALEKLLPILDELAEKGEEIKAVISAMVQGAVEGIANALPLLTTKILEAVDILIQDLFAKIQAFGQWFLNLDMAVFSQYINKGCEILAVIITSVLDFLVKNSQEWTAKATIILMNVLIGTIEGITERLPELIEKVILFIIAFINGITAAIKEHGQDLIDAIGEFIDTMWEFVWNAMTQIGGKIGANMEKYIWKPIGKFFSDLWNNITREISKMWNNIVREVSKFFTNIGNELGKFVRSLGNNIKNMFESIVNGIKNAINKVFNAIGDFFKGIFDWVGKKFNEFKNWFQDKIAKPIGNLFGSIGNKIKSIFGIHSPSTEFEDIGENVALGFVQGVENEMPKIDDTMNDFADTVMEGAEVDEQTKRYDDAVETLYKTISDALINKAGIIYDSITTVLNTCKELVDSASDYFKESILNIVYIIENNITEDDLTIRPIMDLTEIQNGIIQMKSMLNDANSIRVEASSRAANTVSAERARAVWREHAESQNNSINPTSAGDVYNVTFNITGDNPKAIADEVSKVFQHKVSRRDPRW